MSSLSLSTKRNITTTTTRDDQFKFKVSFLSEDRFCNALFDSYLLLVSGLEFGSTISSNSSNTPLEFSTQLLADFITGRLGGPKEIELASQITR